ncbi:MAG TPA: alpha-ketoglutarate-dependent dioxygenase AlkB [Terriglobia bacterium]|nr:alpha-ketoglutarate-dependent dioxygenase AlkB [Terriglobia bacterium]HUN86632.1 alpha-ketoglutarate-dependent dioxygenase AlkB [Terracidiphilus sp.]
MNLFTHLDTEPTYEEIAAGAVLMRGLALEQDCEFLAAVDEIVAAAPLHRTATPSGLPMQVMVTDCGDPSAFQRRWDSDNPQNRRPWPPIPKVLREFALRAAVRAGFPRFRPDSCHINRYQAGTKLGLHQDRHERDFEQPIVSVSLGLPCVFLFGGLQRTDKARHILLEHGDVIVWGGPSRMCFHGVQPLKPGSHPLTGPYRINLTFRKIA